MRSHRCHRSFAGCTRRAALLLCAVLFSRAVPARELAADAASRSTAEVVQQRSAAQRETARTWVLEGRRSFASGDYQAALERYTAAYQLMPVPTVGIEVARAQEALGRWVEANATAVEVINLSRGEPEPMVFEQAREAARELLRRLTPRIPALQLHITPASADVQLQIDGEPMPGRGAMPFKLNPGTHQLSVWAPGYLLEQSSVTLSEGDHRVLPVALVPAPAPPLLAVPAAAAGADEEDGGAARQRGYVALGVAGVAGLLGTVTGILAFSSKPDCPGNLCQAQLRDEANRSRRFGNVATVSFGAALAIAAYGSWELLLNAQPEGAPRAAGPSPQLALVARERGAALQLSGAF